MATTFAWFTASQSTAVQTIQAASYSAEITINGDPATQTTVLEPGSYAVAITADGTASTGYFIIEYGGQVLHTAQVTSRNTVRIDLVVYAQVTLRITPQWGTSSKTYMERVLDGYIITYGEPPDCTCGTKCTELNPDCPLCAIYFTACQGAKSEEKMSS